MQDTIQNLLTGLQEVCEGTSITQVSYKSPDFGDPVTNLDTAIHSFLANFCTEQDWLLISEEEKTLMTWPGVLRESMSRVVLVADPIDGTKACESLLPEGPAVGFLYGSQMTALYNGQTLFTVIYLPQEDFSLVLTEDGITYSKHSVGTRDCAWETREFYSQTLKHSAACFNPKYYDDSPFLAPLKKFISAHFNFPSIAVTCFFLYNQKNWNIVVQKGCVWDLLPLLHVGWALGYASYRLDTLERFNLNSFSHEIPGINPGLILLRGSEEEVCEVIERMKNQMRLEKRFGLRALKLFQLFS